MLTALHTCILFHVELFIAVSYIFLVVISSSLLDFLRIDLTPVFATLSVHTHSLRFLAAPLEHEIMPLAFIGGADPSVSLLQCQ